jgi:hypothetical protein
MREIRLYGSEGGAAQLNAPSLPLLAHLERTGSRNIRLRFRFRQSVGIKCGDEVYPTKRGDKV